MNLTGWSKSLEVTADGEGIVSHAGLALLRHLADKTGLTGGLSRALASPRLLIHDRGRVTADLACAIADGSEVISDFRVLADQKELFGPVASVPTTWRALDEIGAGGPRALTRITGAVNGARRQAWAATEARHGALPGVRIADKVLQGVTCVRLDATVTPAHSDKELAEPNFKGFGHHPLLGYCDNTGEPLAGMMRRGGAGSNTTADHLQVLGDAIAALPPAFRRRLMVTADGAGASHGLITRLDQLAARPGHQLTYSVGWELGARERAAIRLVPEQAWQIAIDQRGQVRERRAPVCLRGPVLRAWAVLGGRSPRHRADRAAARRPSRRPAGRLARQYACLCPPGTAAPRRPAEPVRDRRRLALLPVGLECARRAARLARPAGLHRRCPPGAREGGGLHQDREGLRDRPVPLTRFRDELRVAGRRLNRRGLAVLAAAARPRRRPGQSGTKDVALPGPACRREAGPRWPPPAAENPRHLALGRGHRHRLGPDHRPATRALTSEKPPLRQGRSTPGPVEPPATGPPAGPPSYPDRKITNCSAAQPRSRGGPPPA